MNQGAVPSNVDEALRNALSRYSLEERQDLTLIYFALLEQDDDAYAAELAFAQRAGRPSTCAAGHSVNLASLAERMHETGAAVARFRLKHPQIALILDCYSWPLYAQGK